MRDARMRVRGVNGGVAVLSRSSVRYLGVLRKAATTRKVPYDAKHSHIATSVNIKWTLNNIFLTNNSNVSISVFYTQVISQILFPVAVYEESVRAKEMLKPFSLVTRLQVG